MGEVAVQHANTTVRMEKGNGRGNIPSGVPLVSQQVGSSTEEQSGRPVVGRRQGKHGDSSGSRVRSDSRRHIVQGV